MFYKIKNFEEKTLNKNVNLNEAICLDIMTTGIDPLRKNIIMMGYQKLANKSLKEILFNADLSRENMLENEKVILKDFLYFIKNEKIKHIIGFNILFDIEFIRIKSIKHELNFSDLDLNIYDLREIFLGEKFKYTSGTTLQDLLKFLSIKDENRFSGADIPFLFFYGKYSNIIDHLNYNLDKTKLIFNRLYQLGY